MHCALVRGVSRAILKTPFNTNNIGARSFFLRSKSRELGSRLTSNLSLRCNRSISLEGICLHSYYYSVYKYGCRKRSTAVATDPNGVLPDVSPKGKKYSELENDTFHSYLENNPNYSETIHKSNSMLDDITVGVDEFNDIIKKENWTKETSDDYFHCFIKAGCYASKTLQSISEPVFFQLCDAFPSKSAYFNDDQLIKCFICLRNWPEAPGVKDTNFLKVWKALDAVCLMKRLNWNLKQTLYMIDLWYSLKLTRLSAFVMKSVLRYIDKAKKLTNYDLVQLLFYINTLRKVPKDGSIYEVEHYLSKIILTLTIEELAIVCSGFFKSQSKVVSVKLIDDVISMLIKYYENTDPVYLASILKFIRYTQKEGNIDSIKIMFDTLTPVINKYALQVLVHFALVSEPKQIFHHGVISELSKKFLSSPSDARLKDLEKIAKLVTLFENIESELTDKVCRQIISEIESERRELELKKYTKCVLKCLCYLSFRKYYSEKITSKVLIDDLLLDLYGHKYQIEREIVLLDQNITLEFPEYKGNKLSTPLMDYCCKRHSIFIPGMLEEKRGSTSEKLLRDVMIAVRSLAGDRNSYWHCTYFLPHFPKADILIHLNENNELLPIPSEIKERNYFTGYIKPPKTSGKWLLFVTVNKINMTSDNHLAGEQICKLRQLEFLGYSPVSIFHNEFYSEDTPDKQLDYIKKKMNSSLKEP